MANMKTTIDIPDELFREAKARAAMEGIKLKDLVADALRAKLHPGTHQKRRRVKFPIIEGDPAAPPITDEMVKAALEQMYQEEDESYAKFVRR
jgi:hypothetical protein